MEVAAVGYFVAPIMTRVISAGFHYLKYQFRWKKHVKEVLERLRDSLPKIQAVVAFASSQTEISDQHLYNWLWQLRDAIDEADDVLDDFEYIKHQQQLTKNNKKKKVRFFLRSMTMKKGFVKFGKRVLKIDPNLKRLEKVVKKLDKVSAGVRDFLSLLKNANQEQQEQQLELYKSRETGPLPKNDIIGRGNDKEYVMQWLMSKPSNEEDQTTFYKNISLLSIVGHGGMGKTTLLQHVYKDVKTEEFPLKMWVCVSNDFDSKKVISDMLECLTKETPRLESLGQHQESLKSKVNSNKFLLVLDDIWEEVKEHQNKSIWEDVLAPLASESLGSKILITTRMESVASMMAKVIGKKSETRKIEGLEERECLQLLNAHAFAGVENPDDHKKLKSIAGEMVKRLSGSPLAAKIMGGVLNSCMDERYWDKVLNSDIGSLKIIENDIMPILRLSYTFLPKPLQICFAFCGIFKQDHQFDRDDLVRMWISLGFIQPPDNREETMEDIGGRYFDALVKKSFFDRLFDCYKMHDLLHELAQSVSKHECLRVEDDQQLISKTPETIRHLFLTTRSQEELKKIGKFKNMRSLFLIYKGDNKNVDVEVISEISNATRSIRLLHIYGQDLEMIPQAFGYLTHLRYLKVADCHFFKWPKSLCNLYHLQFMIWQASSMSRIQDIFPKDMNNLSNLRYFKFPSCWFPRIHEIGKLTSLQELDDFKVNKFGYRIGELEQMNHLRKLSIKSLKNVEDAQEACNAKLLDKSNLTELALKWGFRSNPIDLDDEKVLDNLQPPRCLQKLMIDKYLGVKSAIWMNTADSISNLEIIKLTNCLNWQTLPSFGQLRFLKSLLLHSMPNVDRLDNKFHGSDAGDMFPCLTELYLLGCPKLQELPYLPPKLKKLHINNIGWKTLNFCTISKLEELDVFVGPNITNIYLARIAALRLLKIRDCPNLNSLGGHQEVETIENCCSISKYSPLEVVKLLHCPNITNISLAGLAPLRLLEIQDCPNLNSLGGHQEVETTEKRQLIVSRLEINNPSILLMEPLRSITSLQNLIIENNNELVSFPIEAERWFLKVSSSLLQLNFRWLRYLQSLPSSLESLSSLKTLIVDSVPQLRELPNLPPSLAEMQLENLNNLDCLPSCLPSLSCLIYLSIHHVPRLQDLPDLPSSLKSLSISECHPDLMERYRRDEGSDWHKIAHIHDVYIY